MKIISKHKDYYDYIVSIMGMDELVVYDRRDSFPIDPTKKWGDDVDRACLTKCNAYLNSNIEKWFRKEPVYGDKKKEEIRKWNTHKVSVARAQETEPRKYKFSDNMIKEGLVLHFVLEIGYHHYYFEVERYIDDEDETRLHLEYGLVGMKDIEKDEKISYAPMCLAPVSYQRKYWYNEGEKFEINDSTREQKIDNPILYSTYIPKFINAYEVWTNLYEYISSLRDKEFEDTRTNDQHIESHGFDRKISFRHRKNK